MIEFKRIINPEHPMFSACSKIYKNSFPIHEQRDDKAQVLALEDKDYYYNAVTLEDNNVVGILLTWETQKFVYVEHLAIDKALRGKNIGTLVLTKLKESTDKPIILEIDPPVDDVSIRRKGFYEKLGFVMLSRDHIHPPFTKDQKPYTEKIMCYPLIDDEIYNEFFSYENNTVMKYSDLGC